MVRGGYGAAAEISMLLLSTGGMSAKSTIVNSGVSVKAYFLLLLCAP